MPAPSGAGSTEEMQNDRAEISTAPLVGSPSPHDEFGGGIERHSAGDRDRAGELSSETLFRWIDVPKRGRGRLTIGLEFDGRRLVLAGISRKGSRQSMHMLWVHQWDAPPTVEELVRWLREFAPQGRPIVDLTLSSARSIVRKYSLPPLPARGRLAAALWKGRKLVPFPLGDADALFGLDLIRAGERGWQVALAAVPRDDAQTIVEAIERLGWQLRTTSLVGTIDSSTPQKKQTQQSENIKAIVTCSPFRGSFSVFNDCHLMFHYDLGAIPDPPDGQGDAESDAWRNAVKIWVKTLHNAVEDAFDFYLNVNPGMIPSQLEFAGVPETMAPYLTDWHDRFESTITIYDPTRELREFLPDETAAWINSNIAMVTPGILAASGRASIDLTPASIRKQQKQLRLLRLVRMLFVVSVAAAGILTGLLWKHGQTVERSVEQFREEVVFLQESPAVSAAQANLTLLGQRRAVMADATRRSVKWMPWVKTICATLPVNATLSSIHVQTDPVGSVAAGIPLIIQLEGLLHAGDSPHPLNYRQWIRQLEQSIGVGRVELVHEHTTEWKGRKRSAFTIELKPVVPTPTENRK